MKYFFETKPEGVIVLRSNTLDFLPHLHSQIEMGCLHSGTCDFYNDGVKYRLRRGDFFISFPNCIHSYSRSSEDLSTTIMIFSPDTVSEYRAAFNSKMPTSPVFDCRGTPCEKLLQLADRNDSQEYLRGIALAVCADALRRVDLSDYDGTGSDTLRSILIYLDANFTSPLTLGELADALHISRSRISHIFRDKLHTTFTQYLNAKRVSRACALLRDGCSVTDAAFSSGFETVRTFNRAFLRNVGVTPREFRAQNPL